MSRDRHRQRVIDALNGNAPDVDPAVKRALLALADEIESTNRDWERRNDDAEKLAASAVDALAAVKARVTTIAVGVAIPIIGAALTAALRLT